MGNVDNIKIVLERIRNANSDKTLNGYYIDKEAIRRVFEATKGDDNIDILARLSILDNMYSTKMGLRYYGLDDLAVALLGFGQDTNVRIEKFATLLNTIKADDNHPNATIEIPSLFSGTYGIGKEGEEKGRALSLITKYAYFETLYKFPIYDSIVKEMYPLILAYCGINEPKFKSLGGTIDSFLPAIKYLKEELSTRTQLEISFDDLDQLLWTTGKILRGNMSLVFNRDLYKRFGKKFNIRTWDFITLKSRFEKEYIYPFLILAKELSTIEYIDIQKLRISGIIKYFADIYNIKIEIPSITKDVISQNTLISITRKFNHSPALSSYNTTIGLHTTIQQVYDIFKIYGLNINLYEIDYHDKERIQNNKLVIDDTTIQNYLLNKDKENKT